MLNPNLQQKEDDLVRRKEWQRMNESRRSRLPVQGPCSWGHWLPAGPGTAGVQPWLQPVIKAGQLAAGQPKRRTRRLGGAGGNSWVVPPARKLLAPPRAGPNRG